jgi:transcriptional regulator with XRE-family HTH domain
MTSITTPIRKLRKERGFTLTDIATKVGTTPQTIQRLETGNMTVSVKWLEKIAKALDVSPSKLLADPIASATTPAPAFIDAICAELVRTRRIVPLIQDAPLALVGASGLLAERLLEWQAGLISWNNVTQAAAATAAAAMRIALDGEPGAAPATKPAPKLVVNQGMIAPLHERT